MSSGISPIERAIVAAMVSAIVKEQRAVRVDDRDEREAQPVSTERQHQQTTRTGRLRADA